MCLLHRRLHRLDAEDLRAPLPFRDAWTVRDDLDGDACQDLGRKVRDRAGPSGRTSVDDGIAGAVRHRAVLVDVVGKADVTEDAGAAADADVADASAAQLRTTPS